MGQRRSKGDAGKQNILLAASGLIAEKGVEAATVRAVCEAANISVGTFYYYFQSKDDLIFRFVTEDMVDTELETSPQDAAGRVIELYLRLIQSYQKLGLPFMKHFYATNNPALSAYTKETNGRFLENSILERSEQELRSAAEAGLLREGVDCHLLCKDICTIIKGSVFEWCLCDGEMDIRTVIDRIIRSYLRPSLREPQA